MSVLNRYKAICGRCAGRVRGYFARCLRIRLRTRWLAYVPFFWYLLYLMVRHRSVTLFTAANPGIASGGVVGESKSRSLALLRRVDGAVADFFVVEPRSDIREMARAAASDMARMGLAFPVVVKPDVGERGNGVAVVRSRSEMARYFRRATGSVIVQRLVEGIECGIFYVRYPDQTRGRVVSIAQTRFPEIEGDGHHTLEELLRRQTNFARRRAARARIGAKRLREIPVAGQRVRLVELGFSCHEATFRDRGGWNTPALEQAIEALGRAHPGFHFGRFDVYAESVDALRRGLIKVIELNGVIAEATHMYDPTGTIPGALRVLRQQWRVAFEIGAANRARGAVPTPTGRLLALVWRKFRGHAAAPAIP